MLRENVQNLLYIYSTVLFDLFHEKDAILKHMHCEIWEKLLYFGTVLVCLDRPDRNFHFDQIDMLAIRTIIRSISVLSFRSPEHILRRLGRLGRSGRLYGNQA